MGVMGGSAGEGNKEVPGSSKLETTNSADSSSATMNVFPDDASLRSKLCPFSSSANAGTTAATSSSPSSRDAWDRVVKCIGTHHKAVLMPPYTMTMTCYIPSASVGAVIGRRGQTVAQLQKNAAVASSTNQPVRVSVVAATKELQLLSQQQQQQQQIMLHSHPPPPHASSALTGAGVLLGGQVNTGLAPSLTVNPAANNPVSSAVSQQQQQQQQQPASAPQQTPYAAPPSASSPSSSSPLADYHTYTPLDWSDPAWTPVVIRADAPAVCHAAQGLVELIIKSSSPSSIGSSSSAPSSSSLPYHLLLDQVILDVPIAASKHATLLGPDNERGCTLATLSAEADVRIMVPPTNQQQQHRLDLIQLEGDLLNVLSCLANIFLLFVSPATTTTTESSSSNTTATATASANSSSSVSTTLVLSVLPSQTKLRNIARKTDCQVRKQRRSNTLVIIGSTQEQVQTAVALLQKWQAAQQQQQQQQQQQASNNEEGSTEGGGGGDTSASASSPSASGASQPNTPPRSARRPRGGGRAPNKQRQRGNN